MTKRPSLHDALTLNDVTTPQQHDVTASQRHDASTSKQHNVTASRRYNVDGDAEQFRTTVYIPRRAHEQLRNIAHKQRRKVSDVIGEAIDVYLRGRV